MNVSENQQG